MLARVRERSVFPCEAEGSVARCGGEGAFGRDAARRQPFGAWRSLVAHLLWEQRVGGSNPPAPTTFITASRVASPSCHAP
jgi:hypothetical protein